MALQKLRMNEDRTLIRVEKGLTEPYYLDEAPAAPTSVTPADGFPNVVTDPDTYPTRPTATGGHGNLRALADLRRGKMTIIDATKRPRAKRARKAPASSDDEEDDEGDGDDEGEKAPGEEEGQPPVVLKQRPDRVTQSPPRTSPTVSSRQDSLSAKALGKKKETPAERAQREQEEAEEAEVSAIGITAEETVSDSERERQRSSDRASRALVLKLAKEEAARAQVEEDFDMGNRDDDENLPAPEAPIPFSKPSAASSAASAASTPDTRTPAQKGADTKARKKREKEALDPPRAAAKRPRESEPVTSSKSKQPAAKRARGKKKDAHLKIHSSGEDDEYDPAQMEPTF